MRGNKRVLTIVVSALVGIVVGFVLAGLLFGFDGTGLLGAGVTGGVGGSQPTYGTAVVDGSYLGDWDLSGDFFTNMYRAGNTSRPIEARLYLRYDCGMNTMYVLVLSVNGREVDTTNGEAWVALNSINNKVSFSAFEFVYSGSTVVGWEASFSIGEGSYNLWAHTNVYNEEWQTAKAPFVPLSIECHEPTAVFINFFEAKAVYGAVQPGVAATRGGVLLRWETAAEINNLGYNVYRGTTAGGPWIKLNGDLIPSLVPPGSPVGATYEWIDPQGTVRNFYLLEDVDINGTITQHGPVRVVSAGVFGVKP